MFDALTGFVLPVFLTTLAIYAFLIVLTRICGLRSFSKMSGFDFAMTVAVGSTISSTATTGNPDLAAGALGLACIFFLQLAVGFLRRRLGWFEAAIDNAPRLLVRDGRMLEDAMRRSRVTRDDVYSKLRAANVVRLADVRAVVLETTGDISVIHGEHAPEDALMADVRGWSPEAAAG